MAFTLYRGIHKDGKQIQQKHYLNLSLEGYEFSLMFLLTLFYHINVFFSFLGMLRDK